MHLVTGPSGKRFRQMPTASYYGPLRAGLRAAANRPVALRKGDMLGMDTNKVL